jgi:hypothetical protein
VGALVWALTASMIRPLAFLPLVLAVGSHAAAQEAVSATLSSNMPPLARLSLSANSLSFPDADPDLVPQIVSAGGPITITAKVRAGRDALVTLTVQADDDLRSGIGVLPVSLITWTASGPGFVNGAMSRTAPQLVGSWIGSGVRSGIQTFRFENRWTHPSGTYTVTLLYTLTAP